MLVALLICVSGCQHGSDQVPPTSGDLPEKQVTQESENDESELIYFVAATPTEVQIWQTSPLGTSQKVIHQVPRHFEAEVEGVLAPEEYALMQAFLKSEDKEASPDSVQFISSICQLSLSPRQDRLAWLHTEKWCYDEQEWDCFGMRRLVTWDLTIDETAILIETPRHLDMYSTYDYGQLAWSPNGRFIAFVETIWEMRMRGGTLKVLDTHILETTTLYQGASHPIAWSEDGKWIASATRTFDGRAGKDVSSILIHSVDGNASKELSLGTLDVVTDMEWYTPNQIIFDASQIPSGKSSAVGVSSLDFNYGIYVLNTDTGEASPLIFDDTLAFGDPHLSPSKRFLAVDVRSRPGDHIEILRVFDISNGADIVGELHGRRDLFNWKWGSTDDRILVRMSRDGRDSFSVFFPATSELHSIPWPSSLEQLIGTEELRIGQGEFVW
jgi:hypothetical protein